MDKVEVNGKMVKRSRVGCVLRKIGSNLFGLDGQEYTRRKDGSLKRIGDPKSSKAEKKAAKKLRVKELKRRSQE